jgi:uncharacterized protein YggE
MFFTRIFVLGFFIKLTFLIRLSLSQNCCESDNTIELSGRAEITLSTDIIKLGFTIKTKESEADKAHFKNSQISIKIDDIIKNDYNISEKNITTIDYRVTTNYILVENKTLGTSFNKIDGFTVENMIEVRLSDKSTASKLISSIVKSGVNEINYVNFVVNPLIINLINLDLISKAASNAKEKARIVAQTLDLKILGIKRVSIGSLPIYNARKKNYAARMMSEGATEMASAPIYSGEEKISMDVSVVFLTKRA